MLKPSLICVQHAFEMAEFVYISKTKSRPRSRSGPHRHRLDRPGLPVLPSDLVMCGVSMWHPVTTQPEPEAKRTHSIPGHHETGYVMRHRQAANTGLPSGYQFVPCTAGQVCHSLGLRQGTGNLKSTEGQEHVQGYSPDCRERQDPSTSRIDLSPRNSGTQL